MLAELQDKNADIESFAAKALAYNNLLIQLLDGLKVKAENYRYNCYKVLYSVSQTHPEALYPHWDSLEEHLKSPNSYHKMAATHLLANLTTVDAENRFERIFDTFYNLLDDRSMVVAYYIAEVSGRIMKNKPELEKAIIERLLDIDATHHQPGRKELIKAGIIQTLDEYLENTGYDPEIIRFVEQQINSESRKTAKGAREFLKKWTQD
jgi:hypothetical protein